MSATSSARRGHYDAIVVGGGHNGIVAAAYLARAGRSVIVLERLEHLGGAAVSAQAFAGVDARISRYAYLVSLLPDLIVRELELPVSFVRRRVSSYTPDPRVGASRGLLLDSADAAATAASFDSVAGPRALDGWKTLYETTGRLARAIFPTLTEPLRSRAELRALVGDDGVWRALFEEPLGAWLARALPDDLLRGVALTDALIGTHAAAGDEALLQNRCFLYHVIGRGRGEWLVPAGGMGTLTSALAGAAERAGAELLTRAEVLAIEPASDAARVRLTDHGEALELSATHVLAGVAPVELERLLGTAPTERPEGSQLKVNVLLSRLPRLRDAAVAPERAFAGTFHVNETAAQLQRAYEQACAGTIPEEVPCEFY